MWDKPKKKLGYDTTEDADEIERDAYREENTASFKLEVLRRATCRRSDALKRRHQWRGQRVERGMYVQIRQQWRKHRTPNAPLIV
jgi:hypothetical protein